MAGRSAGLLLYRAGAGGLEVLLAHPGGPLWRRRDAGAWSIPKGEHREGEDGAGAAAREFEEETGTAPPRTGWIDLGEVRQRGGKVVHAWACAGDLDAGAVRSNTFSMEWPPGSATVREFPEIDRAEWFDLPAAREKIVPAQAAFLDRLAERRPLPPR